MEFLKEKASGNIVEAHIVVSRTSFPDIVFCNGPTLTNMTLLRGSLKAALGAKEREESSDLAFLPFNMTCKSLKHLFL